MKIIKKLAQSAACAAVLISMCCAHANVGATINEDITQGDKDFQIAVSPTHLEFDLVPGKTTTETFRIRNIGKLGTRIKIGLMPMQYADDIEAQNVPRNEILEWSSVWLEPGCGVMKQDPDGAIYTGMSVKEECFVTITTETPEDAPFGEQYMTIYFQEYRADAQDNIQAILSIGASIYGTNRTGESDGDICGEMISQDIPFWVFEGPLATKTKIKNCGRLNFHSETSIEVYNLFGAKVYEDTAPQDRIISADTERTLEAAWSETGIGIYRTVQTVSYLGETYIKEGWTFLIPLWLILLVVFCIAIAIAAIIYECKKKVKKLGKK